MDTLLTKLRQDFAQLDFQAGSIFSWSPQEQIIRYKEVVDDQRMAVWSLLHELGHALLGHTDFLSDFDLVQMEAAAWDKALSLAHHYGYKIDNDHIQDCLDTYRDWLHQRSVCPICATISLQHDATTYSCYNCNATWHVARTRHCRPYRRIALDAAK
jgi:hypothetical protein